MIQFVKDYGAIFILGWILLDALVCKRKSIEYTCRECRSQKLGIDGKLP